MPTRRWWVTKQWAPTNSLSSNLSSIVVVLPLSKLCVHKGRPKLFTAITSPGSDATAERVETVLSVSTAATRANFLPIILGSCIEEEDHDHSIGVWARAATYYVPSHPGRS